MTNQHNSVLYIGVTNNILRRAHEHRTGNGSVFTTQHNITKLVYIEEYQYIDKAVAREKVLKKFGRQEKVDLINQLNPHWNDLVPDMLAEAF